MLVSACRCRSSTARKCRTVAFPEGAEARQPGGKIVQAWAVEGDWDPALISSNTFEMGWPPRSGRRRSFPEIDRAAWFGIADARRKILKGQTVFVDRLLESAMAVCRDNR
jgi:predicted NUDIX family NTP pyrophosphohydrolase